MDTMSSIGQRQDACSELALTIQAQTPGAARRTAAHLLWLRWLHRQGPTDLEGMPRLLALSPYALAHQL